MILKEQDDRIADAEALERILRRPGLDLRTRRKVEEQIRNLKSGDLGESQAAHYLKIHYGPAHDWIVINDLRLEHDGMVAQIDHVLVNRLLDVWLCESKRFTQGVKINAHGEFITFYDGIPRAVPSPIEQTWRHVAVLNHVLASGVLALPTRLGFTLKPNIRSLVLIAGGRIGRPSEPLPGIETVIMADQVKTVIDRASERGNPLDMAKFVSGDKLRSFGERLLALHKPITFDWERRFLATPAATAPPERPPAARSPAPSPEAIRCQDCGALLSTGVANFCRVNGQHFGNRLLCRACQAKRETPAAVRIFG